MEFFLLGSVEVRDSRRLVDVGHARQRHVLAVLLAEPNRVVEASQLVDRVWGQDRLPADPAGALQTYISLLRRVFADSGELTISWQPPGYTTVVNEHAVDLHRFRSLITQAYDAADEEAAALLEEGLGLWRGEPFAGLESPWIRDVRAVLAVQRHATRLDLTDIRLRLGQHGVVLPGLAARAAEHPLDERVAGQLMLALYRSGRQADALKHYDKLRRRLADELGTDPNPTLWRLHQQILTADSALASPVATAALVAARPAVVPHQLPAAPRLFTGRAGELTRLTKALDRQAASGATLVISAIGGIGGIGKTWLALHWAHQNLDRFRDGQLYVDLRGFDPSGQPMRAQTAVRGFLDAMGVAPAAVPADPQAQAGLYRSIVSGKRMLIVADNAREAAQVIPLLPGSPTCTVLVTSRQRLTGLIAAHGAIPVDLDVLSQDEARQVLANHLGQGRVTAEPDAVAELLACCAGLPLALSIVAARALIQSSLPLAALADELRDTTARLDALAAGDLTASTRAVLSWSYDTLKPEAARVLGLLALAPGPDIGLPAAASLTALPSARLRAVLRELEDAFLLRQHTTGRYRMHDLIRLHAAEYADHGEHETALAPALERVTDFYLQSAYSGDRLLAPHRPPIELSPPAAGCIPYQPADVAASLEWFDTEHSNLLAAQHLAAAQGWHALVWQLAWALNTFHTFRGHLSEQVAAWQAGLSGAEHLDQPMIRAVARRWLGEACARAGRHAEALDHLGYAITQAELAGDTSNQALGHNTLARVWEQQGDYRQALDHAARALSLFQALGRPALEARALNAVGWYHALLGEFAQAQIFCESALTLSQRHPNRGGEAGTLDSLGFIALHTGDSARALEYFRSSLALFRDLGHTYLEADVLAHLAEAHATQGERHSARDAWQQALKLYQAQHRITDATRIEQQLATLWGYSLRRVTRLQRVTSLAADAPAAG